jgi:hypothetical protein
MSTTQRTQTSNTYQPQSLASYQGLQRTAGGYLGGFLTNPTGNMFMQGQLAQGNATVGAQGRSQASQMAANNTALGTQGSAGFDASQTGSLNRSLLSNQALMRNNLLIGGANTRNSAMITSMNYRPLQIGGTSTQQTTGLGTWLPQLAAAGISGAASFAPSQDRNLFGGQALTNAMNQGYGASYAASNLNMPFTSQGGANTAGYWGNLGGGG